MDTLTTLLPAYMVPSVLYEVDKIPMLPNGKVDRNSLRVPQHTIEPVQKSPPTTLEEKVLFEIWREVLGADNFGVDDRFFSIGGDSISQIIIYINSIYNI